MKASTIALTAVGGLIVAVGGVFAAKAFGKSSATPVPPQPYAAPYVQQQLPPNNYSTPAPQTVAPTSAGNSNGLPVWAQVGLAGIAALSPLAISALK